ARLLVRRYLCVGVALERVGVCLYVCERMCVCVSTHQSYCSHVLIRVCEKDRNSLCVCVWVCGCVWVSGCVRVCVVLCCGGFLGGRCACVVTRHPEQAA